MGRPERDRLRRGQRHHLRRPAHGGFAIRSGAVDVTSLHTSTIGLSELQATLDELDSGTSTDAKVLVDPRR